MIFGPDNCFRKTSGEEMWNLKLFGMNWKLWLDDQIDDPDAPARHIPEGFVGAASIKQAQRLIETFGLPSFMSLDHDLGTGEAVTLVRWMEARFQDDLPPDYVIHSANPVGKANLISLLESWAKSRGL